MRYSLQQAEHIHLHGRKRSQHRTKALCARTFAGIRCTGERDEPHQPAMASGCVFAASASDLANVNVKRLEL